MGPPISPPNNPIRMKIVMILSLSRHELVRYYPIRRKSGMPFFLGRGASAEFSRGVMRTSEL